MDTHPHLTRQLEIIPLGVLNTPINVVGAGAIGSFTVLALAKMGFTDITVFDDDSVTVENMNCQFYRHTDIGQPKVAALRDLVESFTGYAPTVHPERYEGEAPLPGIVISAVDSMAVRKMIWDAHARKAIGTKLVVDPRMGAESALCYAMRPLKPADCDTYAKTLYSDADAVHERCTAKATMYTACMLSGYVAKVVKDYVCDDKYPRVTEWSISGNAMQVFTADA